MSSRTREHAVRLGTELGVPALSPEEVIAECDLIVEATSAMAMPSLVRAAMAAGKEIICLSVGGFVLDDRLLGEVMAGKSPVHVPSGAIAGLDGVRALREAGLDSLSLTTVKRPASLGLEDISALPCVQNAEGISLSAEARLLFDGSAEEAIRRFPANVNVAVALALAGPGPEKTRDASDSRSSGGRNQALHQRKSRRLCAGYNDKSRGSAGESAQFSSCHVLRSCPDQAVDTAVENSVLVLPAQRYLTFFESREHFFLQKSEGYT